MNTTQLQQEISIIKEMIDKTRKTTAESGHLLIYMGIFSALASIVIGLLGFYGLNHYVMPVIISMAVVNGFIGYLIAAKNSDTEKVKTYPKTIFWQTWMVCGLTAGMIVFLFPFINLYPFQAVPVLVSLVLGIAVFITGTIFELKFVQLSSLAWWLGACIMAIVEEPFKLVTMVAIIVVGWIVPGLILNKQYKKRSVK
jgi:hypothetical protein